MEAKPSLQNALVVYQITQAVSSVVIFIISAMIELFWIQPLYIGRILAITPTCLFVIFWIASKCNYHDLRRILVQFNFILSMLRVLEFLPLFILCVVTSQSQEFLIIGRLYIFVAIITGFLGLSSFLVMVYEIWKSARNVVLSVRSGEHPYVALGTFTDPNGVQSLQPTYDQMTPIQ